MSETAIDSPLTRDQAAEILATIRPEARVVDVVRCTGGEISGAYEACCEDPRDSVVFKVYAPDAGFRAAKELRVYRILADHGVTRVPEVLHGGRADGPLGRPFLLLTKLAGRSLASLIDELTPDQVEDVYRQMGVLLAELHRVELDAFGYLTGDGLYNAAPTNRAYLTAMVDEKLARIRSYAGDPVLLAAVEKHIAERSELFAECLVPSLVHHDFHEGNILVDLTPQGPIVTGCVDVENAIAGDPLADVARLSGYSIRGDQRKLRGLRAGYGPWPADWRERVALYWFVGLVELWDWYHLSGADERCDDVVDQLRALM
jgi:hygromycin-B 7''-O-kinase